MKRATKIKIVIGAVLACLAGIAISQTGFGASNEQCPQLTIDPNGNLVGSPYSEYPTGGFDSGVTEPIDIFKTNMPCCAVIASDGTLTFVDADCVLEVCIPPAQQVFPGQTCPVQCDDSILTFDPGGGAVRHCLMPFDGGPPVRGGGSNFFLLTGTNAN